MFHSGQCVRDSRRFRSDVPYIWFRLTWSNRMWVRTTTHPLPETHSCLDSYCIMSQTSSWIFSSCPEPESQSQCAAVHHWRCASWSPWRTRLSQHHLTTHAVLDTCYLSVSACVTNMINITLEGFGSFSPQIPPRSISVCWSDHCNSRLIFLCAPSLIKSYFGPHSLQVTAWFHSPVSNSQDI